MTVSGSQTVTEKKGGMERQEKDWASGRLVAIRPDVPGKRFDPEDANVLRTDEERAAAEVALKALYEEARAHGEQPPWYTALTAEVHRADADGPDARPSSD